jgi:PAS domain S-box-containing protein
LLQRPLFANGGSVNTPGGDKGSADPSENEQRLALALGASNIGVWDYDPAGDRSFYSDSWYTMLGYRPGEFPATGASFAALVESTDLAACKAALARHVSGERPLFEAEFRMRRRDGAWAWIKSVGKAIERDKDGNPTRLIGAHIDVTASYEARERLAQAAAEAVRASQDKSDFLARTSHEIRTPMNAIVGLSHLMGQTQLAHRQRDYLTKIGVASRTLLGIVDDILDFSKIEAGSLRIEAVEFDLDDLLGDVSALVGPRAREKGIALAIERPRSIPSRLIGDPLRLSQLFMNLLSNAAKFTDRGQIVVRLGGERVDERHFVLKVSVADTGIGISPDQLARLFRPFSQADASISRRFGGTGLGLVIVRQLATLLKGGVDVESVEGVGSTFRFTARLGVAERQPPEPPYRQRFAGRRALVIERNAVIGEITRGVLADLGFAAELSSETEALRRASEGGAFDLIFLDWALPAGKTSKIISRVRALGCKAVVMATTHLEREAVEAELARDPVTARDIVGVVEQPVLSGQIARRLEIAFRIPPNEAPLEDLTPQPTNAEAFAGARVLLVEDNAINQKVASELLALHGIRPVMAGSGEAALAVLGKQSFDLIFMDVQMPGMDGWMTTRVIRNDLGQRATPIVAMTASAANGDRERCLKAGMNDHLGKPISPDRLSQTLQAWLGGARVSTTSNPPGTSGEAPAKRMRPEKKLRAVDVPLDVDFGLLNLSGNRQLLARLLTEFRVTHESDVANIRVAIRDGDRASVRKLAHALKGASATLGIRAVAAIAGALEAMTHNQDAGAWEGNAGALTERLSAALDRFAAVVDDAVARLAGQGRAPVAAPAPTKDIKAMINALSALLSEGAAEAEQVAGELEQALSSSACRASAGRVKALAAQFDFNGAIVALADLLRQAEGEVSRQGIERVSP